jgi:hypothetical protein
MSYGTDLFASHVELSTTTWTTLFLKRIEGSALCKNRGNPEGAILLGV